LIIVGNITALIIIGNIPHHDNQSFSIGSQLDLKAIVAQSNYSCTRGLQNGKLKHNNLELLELSEFVKSLHLHAVYLSNPSILQTTAKSEQELVL
jgi:hypothetical protein